MEDLDVEGAVTVEVEEDDGSADEPYEDVLRDVDREGRTDEAADGGWENETVEYCCTGGANASIM